MLLLPYSSLFSCYIFSYLTGLTGRHTTSVCNQLASNAGQLSLAIPVWVGAVALAMVSDWQKTTAVAPKSPSSEQAKEEN